MGDPGTPLKSLASSTSKEHIPMLVDETIGDRSSLSVLHIEDNITDALLIREGLLHFVSEELMQITNVDRLSDGIDLICERKFDIVLLDLNLPDSFGIASFRRIKEVDQRIPVLIITGIDDERIAVQSMKEGAQDCLTKDSLTTDSPWLLRTIRNAVARHRVKSLLDQKCHELEYSETRISTIVNTSVDAILIVDSRGVCKFANPTATKMFSRASKDLTGQPFKLPVHESGAEIDIIRRDGNPGIVELHLSTIPWDGEEASLALLHDVTDYKKAHLEIKELRDGLELEVKARTRELELANSELEAFCYSVSHDLRAPLRAIHGYSSALLEDNKDQLDESGAKYCDSIARNAQKMAQLIDDLLAFSRLSRQPLAEAGSIDLTELVGDIIQDMPKPEPERKVEFLLSPLPSVRGDKNMLRQVFVNLISNAVKFTALKSDPKVEIGQTGDDEKVIFVKDNGVGFNMQYVDTLFQPFHRLHSDAEFEGTGIGLAIVKRVLARHGGHIWAEGAVGEGATIFLTLPNGKK